MLVVCSDGTLLEVKYGKGDRGIWGIAVLNKGALLKDVECCNDENADRYSDTAHFGPGLKWAYAAKEWEAVK
jgi:hypothetical protein